MPSQRDIKRLMKKYEELNELSFSEFVNYYNGNVFRHVIENFDAFLAACAKVCVLKKTPVNGKGTKEDSDRHWTNQTPN